MIKVTRERRSTNIPEDKRRQHFNKDMTGNPPYGDMKKSVHSLSKPEDIDMNR
jgi:hypothetical protein